MIFTRGYDRLVNLSDAVIAIAVTLLVLPLVDEASQIGDQSVPSFLYENVSQLFLFALSFVVIARFWLMHHQIYRNVEGYTLTLIWVNFVWLLSIVFLPLPTELLGQGSSVDQTTAALYIGTMLLTSVSGLTQVFLVIRRPGLQVESTRGTLRLTPSAVATAAMAVAFVLAATIPGAGVWPLLLLLPSGFVEGRITKWQRARETASRASRASRASQAS